MLLRLRGQGASWEQIASELPGRTADAVRIEYHRNHKPETEAGAAKPRVATVPWSTEEDHTLLAGLRRHGKQWRRILAMLPGRTDSSVRNRATRLQQTRSAEVVGGPVATLDVANAAALPTFQVQAASRPPAILCAGRQRAASEPPPSTMPPGSPPLSITRSESSRLRNALQATDKNRRRGDSTRDDEPEERRSRSARGSAVAQRNFAETSQAAMPRASDADAEASTMSVEESVSELSASLQALGLLAERSERSGNRKSTSKTGFTLKEIEEIVRK